MSRAEENTKIVIEKMMPIIIEKTLKPTGNWGILFNNVEGIDEAWIVNDNFMMRWTDFGDFCYNRELPFLSEDGNWKLNPLTVANNSSTDSRILCPVELLHERLGSLRPKSDEEIENIANTVGIPYDEVDPGNFIRLRLPCPNLYNFMYEFSKEKRLRTRVVIKPNPTPEKYVKENRIILESRMHENKNVGLYLKLPEAIGVNIPGYNSEHFYLIKNTEKYNQSTMKPNQMYECEFGDCPVINEDNLLEALHTHSMIPKRRIFKGTEIMLHYSRAGFLMRGETMKDVLNPEMYTEDVDILRVPFIEIDNQPIPLGYYDFSPIMLDCDTLFSILEAYRGFRYLDFFISPNPFAPVLIEGVKEDRNYPTIQTVLTTLGENVGDIN